VSVVNITQMWSRDASSIASAEADRSRIQFNFVTAFQVLLDEASANFHAELIEQAIALGMPYIGDSFPDANVAASVVDVTPSRMSPILWLVEVKYQGFPLNEDEGTQIEWSDTSTSEDIDQDWNGKAIVNVNGEYVVGLTMDLSDPVLVLRRKFFSINIASLHEYRHSTNSDIFFGFPAGTCRLVGYSASARFAGGAQQGWWDVTARFQFRWPYRTTPDKAWYKRYRNEGYMLRVNEYVGAGVRKRKRAVDFFKTESTTPVLLNSDGEEETNPNNALWLFAQVYGSLPYAALGFGSG